MLGLKGDAFGGSMSFDNRRIGVYHGRSSSSMEEAMLEEAMLEEAMLEKFRVVGSSIRVMVCTIAFGLGVDIPDVDLVVNFGVPSKNSPHNSKVIGDLRKRALEQNAMMGPTQKMSITDIELAISREFINCKRRGKVITPEEKAKRNIISRKQHTRTWRSSGIKYLTDEEREMWSRVTNDLLSDEELDEGTKTITSRAPRWRSNRLNNIIRKLDEKTSMLRDPKYKRLRGPFSDRPKPRDTERNYGLLNQ
ncbi:unnamed protein product [Owenia fusiformis]|uniref:Helicase C-terminal domain-containing protein n=1 Tax=Owenia fusiformis TaxID=6347 RepID=A0A8S4NBF0_OWEFU|nr:unnamed protein product [Owenia fusiformis]